MADILGGSDTVTTTGQKFNIVNNAGGVLQQIVDYTRSTAYRPNDRLAFAGALSFMSLVCARRYRDESNCRSPLYIVGLGDSGIGKQAARSTNQTLAKMIGMPGCVVGGFRSGEALEDSVLTLARLLSQFDEVDTLFNMLKDGKTALTEVMMGKMLDLWSDMGHFTKRRLLAMNSANAKVKVPSICYHPGLCIYGTAVTKRFYEAISDRMATNGLFARLLVVDAGRRGPRQDVKWHEPPEELVTMLKRIAGSPDEKGADWPANRPEWEDTGIVVRRDAKAVAAYVEAANEADSYYDPAEDGADNSLWSRAAEKLGKVALIMAISRDPWNPAPVETEEDILKAREFVWDCTNLSLTMIRRFAYENNFAKDANRVKEFIKARGGKVGHSWLLRHMKMKAQDFADLISTMMETGEVNGIDFNDKTRLAKYYAAGADFEERKNQFTTEGVNEGEFGESPTGPIHQFTADSREKGES